MYQGVPPLTEVRPYFSPVFYTRRQILIQQITQAGLFFTSSSLLYVASRQTPIQCESKRTFYSDKQEEVAVATATPEPQVPKLVQEEISVESFFASKIRAAREELFKYLELSKNVYIEKSENYYATEREVLSTVSSLHDRREELFPNALYVITGGLFGSVLTRKRNILLRLVSPLVCGVISFRIFFPKTYNNLFGFLDSAEKKNLPEVYSKQTELINKVEELVKKTAESTDQSSREVSSALEKVKKTVGEYTGLNVDQVVTEKKK